MIWGDAECAGPDTRYMMQWRGKWRPVVNMFDAQNVPTTLAMRCVKAVLFVSFDYWVATLVAPGEIVERYNRDPRAQRWDMIH